MTTGFGLGDYQKVQSFEPITKSVFVRQWEKEMYGWNFVVILDNGPMATGV